MQEFYKQDIPILDYDRSSDRDRFHPPGVAYGQEPRDYNLYPEMMFAQPSEMEIIPESDWDAYYEEEEATKSSIEHRYLSGPGGSPLWPALDQNGQGFCWNYSNTTAAMIMRMMMGLPMVRLSGHANACMIKNFRDEGGWCGLGAKRLREVGAPSVQLWPEKSMSRSNDNAATWADAAKYRVTEDWVDLTKKEYDQNLTRSQIATSAFMRIPVPSDFNWWSHSVCMIRWVRISKGNWGPLILNSWGPNWERHGLAVLQGSKATANGAVAVRQMTVS